MHFDFTLILVLATFVSGFVVLINFLWLKKRRKATAKPSWLVDYSQSFFPVLALVLVLRSFIFEPFQIPSGSMLPTLEVGDFIVVNKFHYGLRLPVVNKKVVSINQPEVGDVMVFRYPLDERLNYIKRLIAKPGDKVSMRNNIIYLNGQALTRELINTNSSPNQDLQLWQEDLGNTRYQVMHYPLPHYQLPEFIVPEGYYLVMGDNRDHSSDSRFWCQGEVANNLGCFAIPGYYNSQGQPLVVGLVADQQLVGKATAVWMHWPSFFSLPKFTSVRFID